MFFRKKRLDLSSNLLVKDFFDGNETIYVKDDPDFESDDEREMVFPHQTANGTWYYRDQNNILYLQFQDRNFADGFRFVEVGVLNRENNTIYDYPY